MFIMNQMIYSIVVILYFLTLISATYQNKHIHHSLNKIKQLNHQLSWGHFNSDTAPPYDQLLPNWLSYIDQSTFLSQLSIPGTHNSATYTCNQLLQFCAVSQCQSWSILDQLKAGIRFIDLRVNTDTDQLYIGHGDYVFEKLENVIMQIKEFIDHSQLQFVLVAFQANKGDTDKSKQILKLMIKCGLPYLLTWKVPTYRQAKGKVVIMRSYGLEFNLQAYPLYGKQGITDDADIYIQNMFQVFIWNLADKTRMVIETANMKCQPWRFKVNFVSAAYGVLPEWLASSDMGTNYAMESFLRNEKFKGCLGITVMDFPGTRLIQLIVQSQVHNRKSLQRMISKQKTSFETFYFAFFFMVLVSFQKILNL